MFFIARKALPMELLQIKVGKLAASIIMALAKINGMYRYIKIDSRTLRAQFQSFNASGNRDK